MATQQITSLFSHPWEQRADRRVGQEPTGLLPLGQTPGQHNKVESHRDARCRENLLKEASPEAQVDTVLLSFPPAVGTSHPSIPHMPRQQGSKQGRLIHQDGSPTLHLTIPTPPRAAVRPRAQFGEIAVSDHKDHKTETESQEAMLASCPQHKMCEEWLTKYKESNRQK